MVLANYLQANKYHSIALRAQPHQPAEPAIRQFTSELCRVLPDIATFRPPFFEAASRRLRENRGISRRSVEPV